MANTPRSAQSGRFVKKSSKAAQNRSIRSYFAPAPAQPLPTPSQPGLSSPDANNSPVASEDVPDSIGRPPSKLSLQPDNTIHEVLNGVTSIITISDDDVKDISKLSKLPSRHLIPNEEQKSVPSKSESSDKRVLRSKDGSSKITSELSRFFADYDEVVFGPPKEPGELRYTKQLMLG